ncbi:MAG: MBL fold metallo-hydrolase [Clostridia bacterium]|nr:MBL fold metallo-hydrolase [Clostridia bacterium]
MQVVNLYSGSKGNATLIRAGGASILIDAGRSARALCTALTGVGSSIDEINAIFLTHEHTDHTAALEVLLRRRAIPVHITEPSAPRLLAHASIAACAVVHPPLYAEQIAGLTVRSFATPHDSAACVGFRLTCAEGEIGYATDVGHISDSVREGLRGCGTVVLECNHDPEMLMYGRYPADLKRRIASKRGHLSGPDCACFAAELIEGGTRALMLAHLSEENNTPDTAYAELCGAIGHRLKENGGDVTMAIASPTAPTAI